MSNIILTSNNVDSKAELIEGLKNSEVETILLGEKAQQYQGFIEISVKDSCADAELLKIGVIYEGHGLKPQYSINEFEKLIIGFNKKICLISLYSLDKLLIKELKSLFYEFKFIKNLNLIVVVCETEIYCLNANIETIWQVCLDLVIDHEITDEYVKVVTEEETRVFSLLNGRLI